MVAHPNHPSSRGAKIMSRTITLYRDDSTVQVVYKDVKAAFWTAGNTVFVVSQYTDVTTGAHRYIHWPRERFCWFKDEPEPKS
jgi:hypothetical protein